VAPAVILATGGFAADGAGADSLLRAHAPASAAFATTNTKGTTGDGHKMLFSLGAAAVDMDNVQIHPTGFVDPKDPTAKTKTLAGRDSARRGWASAHARRTPVRG
jgi:succinate dehydrogenase/fumarate reductase flavoprotein subunit